MAAIIIILRNKEVITTKVWDCRRPITGADTLIIQGWVVGAVPIIVILLRAAQMDQSWVWGPCRVRAHRVASWDRKRPRFATNNEAVVWTDRRNIDPVAIKTVTVKD